MQNQALGYRNLAYLSDIIKAFITGSYCNDMQIKNECTNVLSFMIQT